MPLAFSAAGLAVPMQEENATVMVKIRIMAITALRIFLFIVNAFQNIVCIVLIIPQSPHLFKCFFKNVGRNIFDGIYRYGKYCSLILLCGVGYNICTRGDGVAVGCFREKGKEEIMSGKILKRLTAFVMCAVLTCSTLAMAVSAGGVSERAVPDGVPVNVTLDGKPILAGQAVIINSVTYVPLRSFSELMGADKISWDAKTNTASVTKGSMTMYVTSGALYISANDRYFFTVEKVLNVSGRLFVPIRAIAEAFSASVSWDANSRTVSVKSSTKTLVSGSKFYNSDDVYWLSRIISAEAAGESLQGKIAVGSVVLNRKESRQYPNTIYGVIFDRKGGTQFTPVASGTIYKTPTQESIIAAKICLEGYNIDEAILFFMNPKIATSNWISKNRPYAFTIGNHAFYY